MACVPTPTDTLFGTVIAANVVTTVTEVFTTLPPAVTTIFTQSLLGSCTDAPAAGGGGDGTGAGDGDTGGDAQAAEDGGVATTNGAGCQTLMIPVISTLDPGGQTVLTLPLITTEFVTTEAPTLTLYDDSCPPTDPPPPPPPPPSSSPSSSSSSSSTPSPTIADPSDSQGYVPTLVTPVDTIVTQVPTTLPQGITILTLVTSTRTYSPTTIMVPGPTPHNNGTDQGKDTNGESRNVLGPVLGGTIGGFFILISIVVLFWLAWRRRRALFRSAPRQNMSLYAAPPLQHLEPDPEPKPYEYGLVGSASPHPSRETSYTSTVFSARDRYDSLSPLTAQSAPPSAWQGGPTIRPVSQVSENYVVGSGSGGGGDGLGVAQMKRPASWSAPSSPPADQQKTNTGVVSTAVATGTVAPPPRMTEQEKLIDVGDGGGSDIVPELRRPKSMLYVVNRDPRSPSMASVALPGPSSP